MRFHKPPSSYTPLGTGQTVRTAVAPEIVAQRFRMAATSDNDHGQRPPGVSGVPEPSTAVLDALTEKDFQAMVRDGLEQRGYTVIVIPDMRRTHAGWPDLAFWHPDRPGVLHCWELKAATTRVTPIQRKTIEFLATVPGVDARVVRPSDWLRLSEEV